jgi:carboxyl-terminal processing protease
MLPLALGVATALGIVIGAHLASPTSAANEINDYNKFDYVLSYVTNNYVDPVKDDRMIENAIEGMLDKLDPHSVYISSEDLKRMNEPLKGNFEGIGIEFNILKDTIVVVSAISGGPSEAVGLRAGDKIVTVNGENVAGIGIDNQGVIERLRGEKGSVVEVGVRRRGHQELLKFTITRDKIPLYSIVAKHMVDDNTGYVKVTRFSATTFDEFSQAMEKLREEGLENLILDLRGNPGGYLEAAIKISDEFLGGEKQIVYTSGRTRPRNTYNASREGHFEEGKLVILIDEGSASASEIVSGAVQDWDRGLVVGRRSFGKGLVQEPFKFPDGSGLRLTVARYYTPAGRSIQRPYDQGSKAYYQDISERLKTGELTSRDSVDFPDSLRYTTDNGRVVYGGGGIMPDVFVPLDTSHGSPFFDALTRTGALNQFALAYVDDHRQALQSRYAEAAQFARGYQVGNDLISELRHFAEKQQASYPPFSEDSTHRRLRHNLKALLARQLYGTDGFYRIFNQQNPTFQKAVELMDSSKPWAMLSEH